MSEEELVALLKQHLRISLSTYLNDAKTCRRLKGELSWVDPINGLNVVLDTVETTIHAEND